MQLCCVARPGGLEPPTAGLEVRCSIQLSYGRSRTILSGFLDQKIYLAKIFLAFEAYCTTKASELLKSGPMLETAAA